MNKQNSTRFVPLLVALGIVVGILLGNFYANYFSGKRLNIVNASGNKLNDLLHIIDDQYVDSVNISDLVEKALPKIMSELDPHSVYISADEVEASMEDLKGSFSGIGIEFTIMKDTVRIIRPVEGGPSESAGLRPGDRIVSIDGKPFVGDVVTNEEATKRLKGATNSVVKLGVRRPGVSKVLTFSVVRGEVPLRSIDAVYMLDDGIGYIRVKSFAETTYSEFLAALARLNHGKFRGLVIDLRGNLGGYMDPAVKMANEFLPKNRLIVYTEGRKSPREEYRSDGRGVYQSLPLVVLVDEVSASASEIFAGAIQDNDRGMIVGRRTFGKGLVQVPIEFRDGSMLRLTKARYYTPSGRCLQKPYTMGDEEDYAQDLLLRAEHGEFFSRDSIKTNGQRYKTSIGRTVYGGGGIIPDIFIPRDTTGMTSYFKDAYFDGLLYQFSFDYIDRNREELSAFKDVDSLLHHLQRQGIVEQFARFAEKNGLRRRNLMLRKSYALFESYLFSYIIDDLLDARAAAIYINREDPAVLKAIRLINDGAAFPKKDQQASGQTACAVRQSWRSRFACAGVVSAISPFKPLLAQCPKKESSAAI